MNKVTAYTLASVLMLSLLACAAHPSSRVEEQPQKLELRAYWIVDGSMSGESAQMYLERYLLPTSLAVMQWTAFRVQGQEIRLDTEGGYRVVRKARILSEPLGSYTIYGYDLLVNFSPGGSAEKGGRAAASYTVTFSYSGPAEAGAAVLPQPLEKALLAAVEEDGRTAGWARVQSIDYLGSGRFRAGVLLAD
jgi:hypothetical protein